MDDRSLSPAAQMRRMVNGFRASQAIHVAVVLGIPDLLAEGPRDVAELADRSGSHPRSLYRLLRALATAGVLEELDGERFGLTPLGAALRTDAPEPVAGHAAFIGRPYYWDAWSALLHSVRTGENAFQSLRGQNVWEYRINHPEETPIFDGAMTSQSRFVATAVLDAYDFGRFTEVVDIGGGRGALIAAILLRWPELRGVVLDQPHVVSGAPELIDAAGVAARCRLIAGSFFDGVPGSADAYILKNVVHDWPDEEASAILRVCRRDIPAEATLVLIERVIPGPNQGWDAAFSDLNMLVSPGGQERTEAEYAELLAGAGFRLTRVVPTDSDVSIVESVPAR